VYNSLTLGQGLGKSTAILAWGLGNNVLGNNLLAANVFYIATIVKLSGITFVTNANDIIFNAITSKSNTINFKSKQYGE
jgi:hypothetical protein